MSFSLLLGVLLILSLIGYFLGRSRAVAVAPGGIAPSLRAHSRPAYHGYYVALWAGIPTFLILLLWTALGPTIIDQLVLASLPASAIEGLSDSEIALLLSNIGNVAHIETFTSEDPVVIAAAAYMSELETLNAWLLTVVVLVLAIAGLALAYRRVHAQRRARNAVERTIRIVMIVFSAIAILTTFGIVLSLFFESLRFFARYSPIDFLFGLQWSPQTAIREDQVGSSGSFGALPVLWGTVFIAFIAMLVAVPIGLLSAIYLAEYAPKRVRGAVKPVLEILAGVPTVVYGFFAILTVGPVLRDFGAAIGIDAASNSAATAGLVMGVMIIPFVSSLSDDVINAVPQSLRDGAAGLGATKSETVRQIILPAALPGIVGAVLLAVSRAIGETMIVVMAAGLAARFTINPFEEVTTVTVQIVSNLTGDTAFDSAKTLSAFALGLMLFVVTLFLNVVALRVVKKYREKYD